MIKSLSVFLRYCIFWLLFFSAERLIFLLSSGSKLKALPAAQTAKSFLVGLWMDTSMAGYICALPLLISAILWFLPPFETTDRVLKWYSLTLVIIFSIICVFNFNIYREWGSKINHKALDFAFNSPNEAIASGASSPILASLLTLAVLIAGSLWLFKKLVRFDLERKVTTPFKVGILLLLIGLNFVAIRGGLQLSPMNESMAYYSQTPLLNHAAVNTEWSLMRDILKNNSSKNPYQYYPQTTAESLLKEVLRKPQFSGVQVLTASRPNVVLIIMESFTADVVESLGGEEGIAPQIEKLASDGIMFDSIYASGDRTDKGVVAILNAFPSQAIRSIMKLSSKQEKLPSMAKTFRKYGYQTTFFYGGESEFFNMKSYLLSHNYQKLIEKDDFDKKDMNSKWGAYDDVVFDKLIHTSTNASQPFFYTLLTLTHHEPFEVPGKPRFAGAQVEDKFRSTAFYADSCLGDFIRKAKSQPWYKNTLFVVVADHGHRLPRNKWDIYHPNRYRIPLLFFGEVIKPEFRGTRVPKIASQTDIASTLFTQLDFESDEFKWSRNILNPGTKGFAFFDWDNGFGVVSSEQSISFDNTGKNIIQKKNPDRAGDEQLLGYGKAYMQQVFQDYLNY